MIDYIQRLFGYFLTGFIKEHALPFGWGPGANGKTTVMTAVVGTMGDYAKVAAMETFTESQGERHPTDLAMLRGARLVTAQETEEGHYWAESRIKALTGGDPITARFMRQDFFTYLPTFKVFIAGNHRPRLRNVDEAMARRIHMIPFNVVIPKKERDPDLPEKLKKEWPEILAWMIEGAVKWQKEGLRPPQAVLSATAEYFDEEDTVGRWLKECCVLNAQQRTTVADLWESWNAWGGENGEAQVSKKRFSQELVGRGFNRGLFKGQRCFRGLRLRRKPR
jgi:putative DNA primase/helicase